MHVTANVFVDLARSCVWKQDIKCPVWPIIAVFWYWQMAISALALLLLPTDACGSLNVENFIHWLLCSFMADIILDNSSIIDILHGCWCDNRFCKKIDFFSIDWYTIHLFSLNRKIERLQTAHKTPQFMQCETGAYRYKLLLCPVLSVLPDQDCCILEKNRVG